MVRDGLALALEHDLTPVAAELYQRLGLVLYDSADYRRRRRRRSTRARRSAAPRRRDTEVACVTCLVYVLRECGEWHAGAASSAAS